MFINENGELKSLFEISTMKKSHDLIYFHDYGAV